MSGSDRFLLAHDRVVQAGAGTGKTHALLTQYLHLVAGVTAYRRAIPPSQICALTFTEKAAAEMRERLTSRVTKICRRLAEENPESPAAALRDSEPALVESADRLGVKLPDASAWEQVLASLGGATISTFILLLRRCSVAILNRSVWTQSSRCSTKMVLPSDCVTPAKSWCSARSNSRRRWWMVQSSARRWKRCSPSLARPAPPTCPSRSCAARRAWLCQQRRW